MFELFLEEKVKGKRKYNFIFYMKIIVFSCIQNPSFDLHLHSIFEIVNLKFVQNTFFDLFFIYSLL